MRERVRDMSTMLSKGTYMRRNKAPLDVTEGVNHSWLLFLLLVLSLVFHDKPREGVAPDCIALKGTHRIPGALAIISSLMARLNLILAFFRSPWISR
jgi:hypothetical protein